MTTSEGQNKGGKSAIPIAPKGKRTVVQKWRLTSFSNKVIVVATIVIAIANVIYTVISLLTLAEIRSGSGDTHRLSLAAQAANRAWIEPSNLYLTSALEKGLPITYQIRVTNSGREPALGVVWTVKAIGVPYTREGSGEYELPPNDTCSGIDPKAKDGLALFPASDIPSVIPFRIEDTPENRQLIDDVLKGRKSLLLAGCFAYLTGGEVHSTSFSRFLRDVPNTPSFVPDQPGKPGSAWRFNKTLTGNEAN